MDNTHLVFLFVLLCVLLSCVSGINKTEELKPLFSIDRVGGARFHPFKDEIMYVSDQSGVLQIYRVGVDLDERTVEKTERLVQTKNRCTSPRYLSDGTILFLHDRGGNENFQIGFIDNDGHSKWLTNDPKAKHLITKVTKNYLYYKANTRDKAKFDVYRIPFPLSEHNEPELLYTPPHGQARAALTNRHETKIVLAHHYSNVHGEISILDLENDMVVSLTKPLSGNKPVRWLPLRFLNKRRTKMLVKTDFQSQFLRLAILEIKKSGDVKFKTIRRMEQFKYDVLSLVTNHRTKASFIELNKDGYSELIRVRIGLKGFMGPIKKVILPLENGVIARGDARSFGRGMAISKDGTTMAISMSNSGTPVDIYMLELDHKHSFVRMDTRPRRHPYQPHYWKLIMNLIPNALKKIKFCNEKLYKIKSFDGVEVQYFLLKPDGPVPEGGFPVVVRLHGGPESQTRPAFNAINQYIVKNGFALMLPNIRGSRGYGRRFLDLDNQEKRLDAIRDIKYLVKDLKNRNNINHKKAFIMGGSYGGYATQLALVTYPELWRGGVSAVGMSSLETFFERTAPWRRHMRYKEYGNYETQRKMLHEISPINKADRIKCPVFFIHGKNDERVPVSESENMYKKIVRESNKRHDNIGKRSVLLIFKDEGHGVTKRANREKANTTLIKWLRENSK
ncbi:dipeptidyl peptidase [Acrasis kona]|uniref:Dipeptidyl peptidase n=1 Tax=Acrasis kona TaxID=1008807 RepID=A0AAW2Z997_9EUKA